MNETANETVRTGFDRRAYALRRASEWMASYYLRKRDPGAEDTLECCIISDLRWVIENTPTPPVAAVDPLRGPQEPGKNEDVVSRVDGERLSEGTGSTAKISTGDR